MKKQYLQKGLVLAACAIMALSLVACGGQKDQSEEDKSDNKTSSQETTKEKSDATMSNLSVKPITFVTNEPDREGSEDNLEEGYCIEATVKNNTDESMEVTPYFKATVEYEDEYGETVTKHVQIEYFNTGISTPYAVYKKNADNNKSLPPIGLAPKEKKTIRYYVHESNLMRAFDLDDNEKRIAIKSSTITELELMHVTCNTESEYKYLPTSDLKDQVKIEDKEINTFGVISKGKVMTGEIVNDTEDRWEMAGAQFDAILDGNVMTTMMYKTAEFIGIGKSLKLYDDGEDADTFPDFIYTYSKEHTFEAKPALLYYKPESEK